MSAIVLSKADASYRGMLPCCDANCLYQATIRPRLQKMCEQAASSLFFMARLLLICAREPLNIGAKGFTNAGAQPSVRFAFLGTFLAMAFWACSISCKSPAAVLALEVCRHGS